jgi:hypothetical protein
MNWKKNLFVVFMCSSTFTFDYVNWTTYDPMGVNGFMVILTACGAAVALFLMLTVAIVRYTNP